MPLDDFTAFRPSPALFLCKNQRYSPSARRTRDSATSGVPAGDSCSPFTDKLINIVGMNEVSPTPTADFLKRCADVV